MALSATFKVLYVKGETATLVNGVVGMSLNADKPVWSSAGDATFVDYTDALARNVRGTLTIEDAGNAISIQTNAATTYTFAVQGNGTATHTVAIAGMAALGYSANLPDGQSGGRVVTFSVPFIGSSVTFT